MELFIFMIWTVSYTHLNSNSEDRIRLSKEVVVQLIKRYHVDIIAIGNGTASRERCV